MTIALTVSDNHALKTRQTFIHTNFFLMQTTTLKIMKQLFGSAKLIAAGAFTLVSLSGQSQVTTFNYTGAAQTYTVPVGVTSITVDVVGAQGGFGYNCPAAVPGFGGRVQATVPVTPGEVLNIWVGGQGGPGGTTVGGTAGFNGGGTGGGWSGGRSGGGGGGASDIRQSGNAFSNRIVIGAGGGGTGVNYSSGNAGGNAGGLIGTNGLTGTYLGGGATQSAGGVPNGVLGAGGNAPGGQTGGGGGGGYYGGGASAWEGGGGGSSYTGGTVTVFTHTAGFRAGNGYIEVTAPIVFSATVTQTSLVLCNGNANASLTASPVGGSGPFTYSWAPSGGNAATASGLAAGTYTVTITDSGGNTATQTFTVTEPALLSASATSSSVTCFGGNDGSATASATGGTSPYTYAWSNAATTSAITGLSAGVYTCTVTCTNGCVTTTSVTIAQPAVLAASTSTTNISCFGGNDGSATIAASGGTAPYTYLWSNGGTTTTITGLAAGTYVGTVTCTNGCIVSATAVVTEPSALSVSVTQVNVACNGDSTGSIDLTVTGGTSPYTFDWNSGAYTTEDLSGLPAGTYVGLLTDANGCTDGGTVVITESAVLVATLAIATDTVCSTDGMFMLTGESPSGGTFSGPGVSAGMFDPATAGVGMHMITYMFTDSLGCSANSTDSIYVDVCTDIQFPVSGSEFSVYPNPNNGTFTLQLNTTSTADVMIYDAQGKLVSTQKMQNKNAQITISESGLYMITVVTADGIQSSQRVIVTE